jgi:ATP-dependent metalloprotease FtsH
MVSDFFARQLGNHDPRALVRAVERGTISAQSPAVAGAYLAALHRLGRERMARDLYARFVEAKGGPPYPGGPAGQGPQPPGQNQAHAYPYQQQQQQQPQQQMPPYYAPGYGAPYQHPPPPPPQQQQQYYQPPPSAAPSLAPYLSSGAGDGKGEPTLRVNVVNAGDAVAKPRFSLLWFVVGGMIIYYMLGGPEVRKNAGGSGGLGGVMSIARGTTYEPETPSDTTFDDVVGVEEAKEALSDIVEFLRDHERFSRLGGEVPKGVLLTGPPGTGKTLLARAVAGEAGCSFFQANGASFEEMFVGVGAKRIRSLFEAAEKHAPAIIFIDEIDAVAGRRGRFDNPASRMSVNQLLSEMDGFEQNRGIIVIAATNLPDGLDPAILRAGRFDNQVHIPPPDVAARRRLLALYLARVVTEGPIDTDTLARGTVGMTGADIKNLVNSAAVRQAKLDRKGVDMAALERAKDDAVMGGPERRSAVISPDALRVTAYHESGHALVALSTAGANPVYKATVVPRGRALGLVMQVWGIFFFIFSFVI